MLGDGDTLDEPDTARERGTAEPGDGPTGRSFRDRDEFIDCAPVAPMNKNDAALSYGIVARNLGFDAPNDATHVERYSILRRIGTGGMGVVYAAYDPTLDRQVALKLLSGNTDDEHARARILREARALAQLSHPNVVQVYEHGQFKGAVYLAMEFVRGRTLRQWMARREHTWREALCVFLQAGEGLSAAHAAGLVHRDFKPDNAVVGEDGRVRVIDFGLVAARSPAPDVPAPSTPVPTPNGGTDVNLTRTDGIVGTPAYMAPEQLEGGEADARTDQFNFCVALYESLFGERPFSGVTPLALLDAMSAPPVVPASSQARVPAFVLAAVLKGLQFDPARRFPDMADLVGALRSDPRLRRRRWVAVGLIGATIPVLFLANTAQESRVRSTCAEPGAEFALRWNGTERDRVRAGLTSTGLPFADATALRVDAQLARYVGRWGDAWADACVRTTVDEERSSAMHARSMECLDDRRLAFESLTELLAEPVVGTTMRAVRASLDLAPVRDCLDDLWLLQWRGQPGAELRSATLDLQTTIARVRARSAVGNYAEALWDATAALEAVRTVDLPGLTVEALLEAGVLERRVGATAASRRHLEEGFYLAVSTEQDHMTALLASELVRTVGVSEGQYDRGAQWGQLAIAIIERTNQRGTLIDARLRNKLGMIDALQGNHAAAEEHYRAALELRQELLGPEHPSVGGAFGNLGILALERGHLDDAEEYMLKCLSILSVALGPQHPKVGDTHAVLGQLHEARGNSEQAVRSYRASVEILEPVMGPEHADVRTARSAISRLVTERDSSLHTPPGPSRGFGGG
ncbi:MAG: serine/threonine-protein kinase [Nannocystaceae bacterium]|nr:serine/threonine-protein kinase [Nannocystaceae bacterium]